MSVLPACVEAPAVPGMRWRFVPAVDGLTMHLLEAGDPGRPTMLLLHGFPQPAFGWRRQWPALAGPDATDRLT
jgi:pimeloyl-ACP methyl ester carboxylesterase